MGSSRSISSHCDSKTLAAINLAFEGAWNVLETCELLARFANNLMASRPAGKSKPLSSGLLPDEERAMLQANMDRYYMNLLDEPVPMLGNLTPRRAAKSAKGREKLVAWLKLLENGAARQGDGISMVGCDLSWMWTELGVAHLRS